MSWMTRLRARLGLEVAAPRPVETPADDPRMVALRVSHARSANAAIRAAHRMQQAISRTPVETTAEIVALMRVGGDRP